jgi:DegV family protein with EDD domain
MVAGGSRRVRVHIHVNNPGEVYLACEEFGELHQQKADDMRRQHGLMNQAGKVAIVTDSGADIPVEEQDRLGIHMVSARLNFGATEYIDYVSLQPAELYEMLKTREETPKTSQPPVGDFVRQYDLLTGHGYEVMSVGLSEAVSGTTQAARSAAERFDGRVRVFDSQTGSCGEGLLAIVAAEAAQQGMTIDEIESLLTQHRPLNRIVGMPHDLGYIVRGGAPDALDSLIPMIYGNLALDLILKKSFGRLVVLKNGRYDNISVDTVTSMKKLVDVERFYDTDRLRPKYENFDQAPLFIMPGM